MNAMFGCAGCSTTAGAGGCPVHRNLNANPQSLTPPPLVNVVGLDAIIRERDENWKLYQETVFQLNAAKEQRDKALLQLSEAERKGKDLCQQNGELLTFLHRLKEDFCGWTCPSVWKTAEGQPHDQRCKDLRVMLDPSISLKRKCEHLRIGQADGGRTHRCADCGEVRG